MKAIYIIYKENEEWRMGNGRNEEDNKQDHQQREKEKERDRKRERKRATKERRMIFYYNKISFLFPIP